MPCRAHHQHAIKPAKREPKTIDMPDARCRDTKLHRNYSRSIFLVKKASSVPPTTLQVSPGGVGTRMSVLKSP